MGQGARRDRREVFSRLVTLLAHLLKREYQPDHRSRSWLATILSLTQTMAVPLALPALYSAAPTSPLR